MPLTDSEKASDTLKIIDRSGLVTYTELETAKQVVEELKVELNKLTEVYLAQYRQATESEDRKNRCSNKLDNARERLDTLIYKWKNQ